MISVVISSYKNDYFDTVSKNIENTIGVPYEIIKVYNPNLMSIAAAYNKGILQAKNENILLLHDDVFFHSDNWGRELLEIFSNDSEIGLVGLAGCRSKSYVASGWHTHNEKFLAYHFIQANFPGRKDPVFQSNINQNTEVAAIDGFFMASRKSILLNNLFDEKLLNGYHGYDLYLSLAIARKYKLIVTNQILVEHLSFGTPDRTWFSTILDVNERFKDMLPLYRSGVKSKMIEYDNLKSLIIRAKKFEVTKLGVYELLLNKNYIAHLGTYHFFKIILYVIYRKFTGYKK